MNISVLDVIAKRRSIRAFTSEPINPDQIDALLKAAMESPSANNAQPWHLTVVRSREVMDNISAEASSVIDQDIGDIFYAAPVSIFISCDQENRWACLDSGIVVQNIALAAVGLGLGGVILGLPRHAFLGSKGASIEQLLGFPEGYKFAVAIAIGHPAKTKEAHLNKPGRIHFLDEMV